MEPVNITEIKQHDSGRRVIKGAVYQHELIPTGNSGTWLQGHVKIQYHQIVKAFGEPHDNPQDGKVDADWKFKVKSKDPVLDGTIFTLYNYKNGHNYRQDGTPTQHITEWNIGGRDPNAVTACLEALEERDAFYELDDAERGV